jgi:hypothetical protein
MYRFSLSGSEKVIALSVGDVVGRVFNLADCDLANCDP